MAWLAVDKDGSEYIYLDRPVKETIMWVDRFNNNQEPIELPKGSIEKLIGKN